MTLGERILKYRKKAGISQEELADKLNVTRQSISLWETDQTIPTIDNLITLSNIFRTSVDDLCGKTPQSKVSDDCKETEINDRAVQKTLIVNAETVENDKLIKNYFWRKKGKHIVACAVTMLCVLMLIIPVAVSPYLDKSLAVIPVATAIPFAIALVCLLVPIRKKFVANYCKLRPNCLFNYRFYANGFDVSMTSDINAYSYSTTYGQIKKVKQNDDYIFIYYNSTVLPVEKATLGDNLNTVLKLLQALNFKETANSRVISKKRRKNIKIALYVMFILSIVSIYFAAIALYIDVQFDKLHMYLPTYVEHLWIMFLFILFPLASLIFGIVCVVKKIAGLRNIVAGIIMCAVLLSCGSCYSYKKFVAHDHSYVAYMVNTISPITLPTTGRVAYSTLGARQLEKSFDAMIQAPSTEEMINCLNNSKIEYVRRVDELNLPNDFLEPYYKTLIKNFDGGCCLYNCMTNEKNTFSEGIYQYIFVAYDMRYDTFYVLYRSYSTFK